MAKADEVHKGITWRDFPGNGDALAKKMNFRLFVRGRHQYSGLTDGLEGEALKTRLQELSRCKKQKWQRAQGCMSKHFF